MLTEMPMKEKDRTVVSSPDRISVIDVSDCPRTGLIGRLMRGGKFQVTVNFMCGKHFSAEFPYKGTQKEPAKEAAHTYLQQIFRWKRNNDEHERQMSDSK